MKRNEVYSIACFLILMFSLKLNSFAYTEETINSNARLAVKFLRKHHTNAQRVFSPILLQNNLATAALGSEGTTNLQLHIGAQLIGNKQTVAKAIQRSSERINATNFLFVGKNATLDATFRNLTEFYVKKNEVDFSDIQTTKSIINYIIGMRTGNLVNKIIGTGDKYKIRINKGTIAVAANVVAFSAKWEVPFPETEYIAHGRLWMRLKSKYLYGTIEELNAKALVLPLQQSKFRLMFLIAKEKNLKSLENSLQSVDVTEIPSKLEKKVVDLFISRIDHSSRKLVTKDALKKQNITLAFTRFANFTSMFKGAERSCIANIAQNSYINLNETGLYFISASSLSMQLTTDLKEERELYEAENESFNRNDKDEPLPIIFIDKNFYFFLMDDNIVLGAGSWN